MVIFIFFIFNFLFLFHAEYSLFFLKNFTYWFIEYNEIKVSVSLISRPSMFRVELIVLCFIAGINSSCNGRSYSPYDFDGKFVRCYKDSWWRNERILHLTKTSCSGIFVLGCMKLKSH